MGEGDLSKQSREEMLYYVNLVKESGLKACLYSRRDVYVENWMYDFDYVKTGSYKEEMGSLYERNTNQRLYHIVNNNIKDITERFWA